MIITTLSAFSLYVAACLTVGAVWVLACYICDGIRK
jgi:hypothetical protein